MLTIEPIELPLKVVWKLSRNQTKIKTNFIITLDNVFKAEVAPNVRYGETSDLINKQFDLFRAKNISNLLHARQELLNKYCHSLMFALESVYIQKEASVLNKTVIEFLNLSPKKEVQTSFSVPIMDIEGIKPFVESVSHYPFLKIKVNSEMATSLVTEVSKYYQGPLRVDGNEAWDNLNDYLLFEKSINHLNIEFIEQPFKAADKHLYKELFNVSRFSIIADESVENVADFEELKTMFHGVNVKLMKSGGLYKAIELLENAKKANLKTMIGCMIETSLGIQSAMYLTGLADYVDLDGFLLLQKDPFNLVSDNNGSLSLT